MKPPDKIKRLVEVFDRNLEAYKKSGYKEANVRAEFIDPFFEVLGWDVRNRQGYAEAYKDVITEDAIKVGGATKAPDYCFRVGGARKFFVEAKKPSVDIKSEISPAYQLRRYAWSAGLPLSILTDFEEFSVYDCRLRPRLKDKAGAARVIYLTYHDYLKKWEEIASIFSKQAVLEGRFDSYVESKKKRTTQEVDAEFLKEIEEWRNILARNIALRNPALGIRELNFAVQKTIDRIIFLRICEDRGIESYGRLQALLNGAGIYERLKQIFLEADDKYNSGIFHFRREKDSATPPDELTLDLKIDDKALKEIFKRLYYPESPYEFSVLGAEILGHIYEQFLGKVIKLTKGHQAKVEEKPEVRKAGGVYYTPTYIVYYIVKNTVGKLCEGKTPKQIEKLRILDPACGSGSFLIGAYSCLHDYHRDWYLENLEPELGKKGYITKTALKKYVPVEKPEMPIYQGKGGQWYLTTREKKRILLNNIYGVDIDSQAVEVTKLSLLLKVLENENQDSLERQMKLWRERALPDLGNNIKCGNSLIGPDFYDNQQLTLLEDEEQTRINAFDWPTEFPEIFNPSPSPSGRGVRGEGGFDAIIGNPPYGFIADNDLRKIYNLHYESVEGRIDIYELFLEKGIQLCRKDGLLGYIVPSPLLTNYYAQKLRRYILNSCSIKEITNFGMKVFSVPTIHSCILILSRTQQTDQKVKIRKQVNYMQELYDDYDYEISQSSLATNGNVGFDIFFDDSIRKLLKKLEEETRPLGELCFIRQCIKTGNDCDYVKIYKIPPGEPWKPTLRGKSISRYATLVKNEYIRYGPWLARNWKNKSFYETTKIAIRETGKRVIATLDSENRYFLSSLYSIYPKLPDDHIFLKYILGILNSALATFYLKLVALDITKGAFTKVRTNQLARLPIRKLDFSNNTDKCLYDNIVKLVDRMLKLNNKLIGTKIPTEKTQIKRQINATDNQIDQLVYELYGLTEKEIRIVERSK